MHPPELGEDVSSVVVDGRSRTVFPTGGKI